MKSVTGAGCVVLSSLLAGCGGPPPAMFTAMDEPARLVEGPPVQDVVTPYDEALECMRGHVAPEVSFAVGQMKDATGRETYSNGGVGKFVSQGTGEMVQSALFRAGVTVVNRRDPNLLINETNWGIREIKTIEPATFYLSGSVNSIDFIPGGGVEFSLNGIGPRYRQNRILVALDLSLTAADSGVVVANVALQKQIFAREVGFSADKFFGDELIGASIGGMEREALNFALRQMLNLATLEVLGAIAGENNLKVCREKLGALHEEAKTVDAKYINPARRKAVREAIRRAREGPPPEPKAAKASGAGAQRAQSEAAAKPVPQEAIILGRRATALAGRAIAAMENSVKSEDPAEALSFANESRDLVKLAAQSLRNGAARGLAGPEGDAAALVVEQAMQASAHAMERAKALIAADGAQEGEKGPVEAAEDETDASPEPDPAHAIPGTPESQRLGGE